MTTATIILWDETPLCMLWGIYQDFFESAGINTGVQKNHLGTFNNWAGHHISGAMPSKEMVEEARISVIKKANEIYNKKINNQK